MKHTHTPLVVAALASALTIAVASTLLAADAKKSPIKDVMQKYHKAPKGTDPVCKKASDGKASPDEIAALVKGYTTLAAAQPPQGDDASWKEKTGKLLAAAKALQAGKPDGVAQYKAAVNCKGCHSVHKPE
jgi:hypothetical protein